jgi:hypothetical protein
MFIRLEISSFDYERLKLLAEAKETDFGRLSRLSFRRGLRSVAKDVFPSNRQRRNQKLDALIREHWETKDDAEIGRLMKPAVSGAVVYERRLKLNLKKTRGGTRSSRIQDLIEPVEFEQMIIHDGYTMTEYMQVKNLHCTRECLRKVVMEMGLKHSPADRAPEWSVMRWARKLGNPNLANREWMMERAKKTYSLQSLAAELGIRERDLYFFVNAFDLRKQLHRKTREIVNLVCANPDCKKNFTRLKERVNRRRKKAGSQAKCFCTRKCALHCNRRRKKET